MQRMSGYTIKHFTECDDAFGGQYPGEMRFLTGDLGSEQVAFTHRRMPQHSGGKGSYGHRHKQLEEIYFVLEGKLQVKLDDEVIEAGPGTAIRVAPETVRSLWNDEPEDAVVIIVSHKIDDPRADGELVEDFWPE
jgi:mannose-6-phosphate isomerase-like protein (cupin superfamily)